MKGHTYRSEYILNIFFEKEEETKSEKLEGKILFAEDQKIIPFSLIIRPIENPIHEISRQKYAVAIPKRLIENEIFQLDGIFNYSYILGFGQQTVCLINLEKLIEQGQLGNENHYLDLYELVKDEINSKSFFL